MTDERVGGDAAGSGPAPTLFIYLAKKKKRKKDRAVLQRSGYSDLVVEDIQSDFKELSRVAKR